MSAAKRPIKAQLRAYRRQKREDAEANKKYFGIIPARIVPNWKVGIAIGLGVLAVAGGYAARLGRSDSGGQSQGGSSGSDSSATGPTPTPGTVTNSTVTAAHHSSGNHSIRTIPTISTTATTPTRAHHSHNTSHSVEVDSQDGSFSSASSSNNSISDGISLAHGRMETTQRVQSEALRARMQEIRAHYPTSMVKALGGVKKLASCPMIRGTEGVGYQLRPDTVSAPITLSVEEGRYPQYHVTLKYEVDEGDGRGFSHTETETFSPNGYSGGVRRKSLEEHEPALTRSVHYSYTSRDLDYWNRLSRGETVQERRGSYVISRRDIKSGKFKMDKWDHPKLKDQLEECIQQLDSQGDACAVDDYATGPGWERRKIRLIRPT